MQELRATITAMQALLELEDEGRSSEAEVHLILEPLAQLTRSDPVDDRTEGVERLTEEEEAVCAELVRAYAALGRAQAQVLQLELAAKGGQGII